MKFMDAERAHMFEAVFNQMAAPVTIIRPNIPAFTIIAMNLERQRATPVPADQIVGRDTFDVFKPWDKSSEEQLALLNCGLIKVVETKQPVKLPVLYFEVPVGGTIHRAWAQVEISPVLNAAGNVEYLISMGKNVTEQELARMALEDAQIKERQMRNELAAANEELTASNEELHSLNEELACLNEELAVTNDQLVSANGLLDQSRLSLQQLNEELEDRVKRRTNALAESDTRFRIIFEAISQMAWTINKKYEATFFNKRWYDYTGMDPEQDTDWTKALHPDDAKVMKATFRQKQPGKNGSKGIENRFRAADGSYRWHLTRVTPVKNQEGKAEMWIATATEIHDLKELQQQKDDFISIASHELKTPITALNASLQLLDKIKDQPQTALWPKLLSQALRSMQKITNLVNDLLNLGRVQQHAFHLNITTFGMGDLISFCCGSFDLAWKHVFEITGDTTLQVYADQDRVEQVILNLVNNAMKYAPDSIVINITVQKLKEFAKVIVTDTGPGIPNDYIPYLFERYYRVASAGYQGSGLGLGLFISNEIIKRHNGQMGVESSVGEGSKFWFTLPLGPSAV